MKLLNALLAASLVTLSALGAFTSANAATEEEQANACRGDAMHFCAADIPDREKITACMKQHVNELSPACRAMFKGGQKDRKKGAPQ